MSEKESNYFKICSCGEVYFTEESFIMKTKLIGSLHTFQYMDTDLELRNCKKCSTTLTRQITKVVPPHHQVAS
ncbi:MAG: hypothetical protein VX619_02480 [bacterium]|nr:hypothetical protein [bacterium]